MNGFHYKDGTLYADDVSVADIAAEHGTPSCIYSTAELGKQLDAL